MNKKTILKLLSQTLSLDCGIFAIQNIQHSKWFQKFYSNIATMGFHLIFPQGYNIIKQNKQFEKKHSGNRCFILGNGPSLNLLDFHLLEKETVFTVNRLMRHPSYSQLNSNYHVCMDRGMFGERDGVLDKSLIPSVIQDFELLSSEHPPTLIIPEDAKKYAEQYNLIEKFNIAYVASQPRFIDSPFVSCDMTKMMSGAMTVVHYAIMTAIYMGFKEIYLLGCDGTLLFDEMTQQLYHKHTNLHCYESTEAEIENTLRVVNDSHKIMDSYESYLIYLKGFMYLNQYCQTNNINLVNLTPTTLISFIPRDTIERVLKINSEC